MRNTAIVVYVSPKFDSNHSILCLEPIQGTPILVHLLRRLQKGLPLGEFDLIVMCHDRVMPGRLKETLKDIPTQCFVSKTVGCLGAFTELLEANKHLTTLLIFREEAIFPDCFLTLKMLRLHRKQNMEGTVSPEYPPGLLPDIYEAAALHRLAELDLPNEVSMDFASVMSKANELFQGDEDKDLRFRLLSIDSHLLPDGPVLEKLPSSLIIDNSIGQKAAERVFERVDSKIHFDSTEACLFKQELLQVEASSSFQFPGFKPLVQGAIPVLFVSEFGQFSGAEESFASLIIHLDRARFQPYVVLGTRSVLSEKLIAAGIPVEITHFNFSPLTPWNSRYFDTLLKRLGIKIVHVNGFGREALVMSAWNAGVPLVSHVRVFAGKNAPPISKYAAKFITISESVTRDLLRSDIDPRKVHCIFNGLDLASFQPKNYDKVHLRQKANIPLDTHVICMIARIAAQKRLEFLLEALPTVIRKFSDTRVLFVGESYFGEESYYDRLQKMIDRLDLRNFVRFWGFEKDIAKIHALSDVVVYCTLNEPFGRSILEAMAMGIPVVVPNQGGPVEIVQHYKNGILFDTRNPQSLATELIRLFSNPDLTQKLAEKGYETVKKFDIAIHVRQVSDLYEKLLETSEKVSKVEMAAER